ncbi:hypothetical protein UlMin_045690 [Ulmus minor]
MAHSLTSPPISTTSNTNARFQRVRASNQVPTKVDLNRRTVSLGLAIGGGTLVGWNVGEWSSARAAARRPPPPPPEEKKDPNVSGVLAKVLASKRRKEAMKEEMAKLRQKGKSVLGSPSE